MDKRYYEIIKPSNLKQETKNQKTGDQIIAETIARMGLKKS